jgi:two-component system chemotaxis response regulator CheY
MSSRRVLSVGQCNFDHGNISQALRHTFAAEVVPAATADQALTLLRQGGFDLVLVNRVFDANGDSGLDLIRQVKTDEQLRRVPVMLVSNFADAQQQAVAAGAEPGFGKAALGADETIDRLRHHLKATS